MFSFLPRLLKLKSFDVIRIIIEINFLIMSQTDHFLKTQLQSLIIYGAILTAGFPFELVRTRLQTIPELLRQGILKK